MQEVNKTRALTEAAMLMAINVMLTLVIIYIPLIGVFVSLIASVPIIILTLRHGLKWGLMAVVAGGIVTAILGYPVNGVVSILFVGLMGLAIGEAFKRGYSPALVFVIGTIATLVGFAALIALGQAIFNVNLVQEYLKMMNQSFGHVLDFYRGMGLSQQQIQQIQPRIQQQVQLIRSVVPALFITSAAMAAGINYWAARLILRRLGQRFEPIPPFRTWYLPKYSALAFIFAVGLIYIGKAYGNTQWQNVGLNVEVVVSIVFLVSGLAVVMYWLNKRETPRFLKIVLVILIITSNFLAQLVVFLGLLDNIIDYRKLRKHPDDGN